MFKLFKKYFFKNSLHYQKAKQEFQTLLEQHTSLPQLEKQLQEMCLKYPKRTLKYQKAFFTTIKDRDAILAIKYGIEIIEQDPSYIPIVATRYQKVGDKENYLKLMNRFHAIPDTQKVFNLTLFKLQLQQLMSNHTEDEIQDYLNAQSTLYHTHQTEIAKHAFILLKDTHTSLALTYGDIALKTLKDKKFIQVLFTRAKRIHDVERLYRYAELLNDNLTTYYRIHYLTQATLSHIETALTQNLFEKAQALTEKLISDYPEHKDSVYFLLGQCYIHFDKDKAMHYIQKAHSSKKNFFSHKVLFDFYVTYGEYTKALQSLPPTIKEKPFLAKVKRIKENQQLICSPFPFPKHTPQTPLKTTHKVLYTLYNSLPYHSGGYASRTLGLVHGLHQISNQFTIEGVTRLGYPHDILKETPPTIAKKEEVDGIVYHRLLSPLKKSSLSYLAYIEAYAKELETVVKKERPFVLHAASNFFNGLATIYVAKKLGLKSIYEVRGLWEVTMTSNTPLLANSERYTLDAHLETEAAHHADIVLTLTEALKEELVRRGVPQHKIYLLPNGVDTKRFHPMQKNHALSQKLQLENKIVIGFVGSFVQYEGLNHLVEAVSILIKRGITSIKVLMVGNGAIWEEIKSYVGKLHLSDYFIFTGRIPHHEVETYYSLIDITPFPRKGALVCEMVSPLKPFESMAMGKAVVVSNVAALTEIITHKENGMVFEKENSVNLADTLEQLILNAELRTRLGNSARAWVVEKRDWKQIAQRLHHIYAQLKGEHTYG
jgi:glycosyltransferase involved in cell wall biosynthesis